MKRTTIAPLASLAFAALAAGSAHAETVVENAYVKLVVEDDGYWSVYTTGGTDGVANGGPDDAKRLVYGDGSTASSWVDVDGLANELAGAPSDPIAVTANGASLTYRFGDVTVTRAFTLVPSTSGNPDAVRIATNVHNGSAAQHTVSVMVGIDTMIGTNDGAPLFTNQGIIRNEIEFAGQDVPSSWQAFEADDVANPGLVAQGTLSGGDATAPDRFLMGYWPNGVGRDYIYAANGAVIGNDTAVALWWDGRALQPGADLSLVTYFGLGGGDTAQGDLALNVTSPAILSAVNGVLSPNPFDVNLVILNNHAFAVNAATATITLPTGLALATGAQVQNAGTIAAGQTALLTWQLTATPPTAGTGGTADTSDLSEGSPASLAALAFVNATGTDATMLDVDVELDARAATNIVAHRDGGDAFDTMAELDAISYVGAAALTKIATYAVAHGFAQGGGGNALYTYSISVAAGNDPGPYTVDRTVEVPPLPAAPPQGGLDVTVHTTSPADFPTIEMIVSVNDEGTGDFVDTLDENDFAVSEDGVPMENCTVELLSQSTSAAPVDIVFIMDVSGSMEDEIEALRQNALSFADTLSASGVDYRLGFVTYIENVYQAFGMTSDASEFRSWVQAAQIDFASGDEDPMNAIASAMDFTMRADAERIFILATDETYTQMNATTFEAATQLLTANHVRLHGVTLPELNVDYDAMVTGTGGRFYDILAPFGDVLEDIQAEITNRYVVRCDTPNPARDNTTRHVSVEVTDGARSGEGPGEYFIEGGALRIDPTVAIADVGSQFTVDVVADSVSGLHNTHVVIDFDASYLTFDSVDPGELLGRPTSTGGTVSAPTVLLAVDHDPSNGRLSFDVARNHTEGTNGTGVLATLTFTLAHAPTADASDTEVDDLVFSRTDVYLENQDLGEIRVTAFSDGDVDTTTPSLLGDFDRDGDIDLVDLNTLASNWGSTQATLFGTTGGDIAPATGTVPNLTAQPDGVVNYRDLFVFTRMFNWYRFER